jgi:two-component system cell cycle sensor histidine kinase/response regulator CckA
MARRLGSSEEIFALLDCMGEGLQVVGFDYRYLYLNEAAARHGHRSKEELLGRTMQECYPDIEQTAMFARIKRCMQDRIPARFDNEFVFPDGTREWFELRIDPVPDGVRVLSVEIERRRKLEEQLAHAQKMEALGLLAGGIAHDFNNLLTIVLSYAQLIDARTPKTDPVHNYVKEVTRAAERGAELTSQLLALGRRRIVEPRVVSVNQAITALHPMLRRLMGDLVEIELVLDPEAGSIRVDPGQLDQVLINLAANARDAMPTGGRLTISTQNVALDESYAEVHPDVTPGPHVKVSLTDTGTGMPPEVVRRIFEPFFTTKGPDRGSGLGLAMSHGIVRQSGGHIWVYSEPGHGTTFKLLFPRCVEAGETLHVKPSMLPTVIGGDEVVLVVEDDPALRTLCTTTLERYGYTVLSAKDAQEALAVAARFEGTMHALVIDMMLPSMPGSELATRLKAQRPELCVLYMSGFTNHALLDAIPRAQYLEKPFTPDMLARRLRQLLCESGLVPAEAV